MNQKGISNAQVFLLCCLVIFIGGSAYIGGKFYFKLAHKKECDENIQKLSKACSDAHVNPGFHFNLADSDTIQKIKSALDSDIPRCPAGGSYISASNGEIFCSVHSEGEIIIREELKKEPVVTKKPVVKQPEPEKPKKEIPKDELFYRKALQEFKADNFGKAITYVKQALELNKNSDYLMLLAEIYFKSGSTENAKSTCLEVLASDPANLDALAIIDRIKRMDYFFSVFSSKYPKDWFIYFVRDGATENSSDIIRYSLSTRSEEILCEKLNYPYLSLMSESQKTIIAENAKIFTADLLCKNKTLLVDNIGYALSAPVISHNEEAIAYCSYRGYKKQVLCLYTIAGNSLNIAAETPYSAAGPSWSADGKDLVYYTVAGDMSEIYTVERDGKNNRQLTENSFSDETPAWAPLRNKIAYTAKSGTPSADGSILHDIYLMDSLGKSVINLTNTPETDEFFPQWSPSCRFIAYISLTAQSVELALYDTESKKYGTITSFKRPSAAGVMFYPPFAWFPDERMIVYSYGTDSNKDIYITDISNGATLQITETNHNNESQPAVLSPLAKRSQKKIKLFQ